MYKDIELADLHELGTTEPFIKIIIPKEYCRKNKIHTNKFPHSFLLAGDTFKITGKYMNVLVKTSGWQCY